MSRQFLLLHHDQNVVSDRKYINIRQSTFSWYSKYFGHWTDKWYSLHQTVLPWTVCHPHLAQVHTERRKTKKEERMVAIMTFKVLKINIVLEWVLLVFTIFGCFFVKILLTFMKSLHSSSGSFFRLSDSFLWLEKLFHKPPVHKVLIWFYRPSTNIHLVTPIHLRLFQYSLVVIHHRYYLRRFYCNTINIIYR